MDRSHFRRPGIQKQDQKITKTTFGNPQPVSEGGNGYYQVDENIQKENNMENVDQNNIQTPESYEQDNVNNSAVLARQIPIDMSLPGEYSHAYQEIIVKRSKWRKFRIVTTRGLAIAIILVTTMGGLLFSQNYLRLHKVFRGTTATAAALVPNVKPSSLKSEGSGRVNILLLGRDGGKRTDADITNSIILLSIDPVNNNATLLSIPGDLWVNAPGAGVMKMSSVWETGEFKYLGTNTPGSNDTNAISAGFSLADQTVNQVLGVNIDYNAIVNYQAFEQIVNTLGGVTVNVPSQLVDPTMAWQNNNNPILANAGTQNFNGQQALLYAMSKETSSDFARAQRQRSVLVALENKLDSSSTLSNPLKLNSLLSILGNNVATDLSIKNADQLLNIFKKINSNNVSSLDLSSSPSSPLVTTGNVSGQSVVLPASGLFNYSAIQQYVRLQLKDPYIMKENAKILILNGTTTPGLATTMTNNLKTYGYNIIGAANTPTSNWANTTLINVTKGNPYTEHYLESRLKVKALNKLPSKNIPTNGADFVIIIGSNEANPN